MSAKGEEVLLEYIETCWKTKTPLDQKTAARYNSKVSALFENIPAYLSTHEKKVVLSKIAEGSTFARYKECCMKMSFPR